jgi:hypothetical protein
MVIGGRRCMGQTVRFQETLRRLAIAPVAGLGGVAAAAPEMATALGMTSRLRWRNQAITDRSSAGHVNLPPDRRRGIPRRLRTNGPSGRPARDAVREASSKAIAEEAGMAARGLRVDGWTVVPRRQPVRMVEGRAEGGYADVFELICCDCGDDPGLDYREVAPRLRLVRGPYPMAAGVAACEQHRRRHQQRGVTGGPGTWPMLAELR